MVAVHLLTTDESGFDVVSSVPGLEISAVIVPQNRMRQKKVEQVNSKAAQLRVPLAIHERGAALPRDVPPASAAICWMYSQIVRPSDIDHYSLGMLNMHGGHIPCYRGANVLQWAIINGEEELWVTWHQVVADIDAGPIWAEVPIKIPQTWTALDARREMIASGQRLFPEAWSRFTSRASPVRNPKLAEGTVWPARRPADGRIQANWSERQLRDFLRALCPPWPYPTIERNADTYVVRGLALEPGSGRIKYHCADGVTVYLLVEAA